MSDFDPKDTQPASHGPEHDHRIYVPAEWEPAGSGTGAPKISGGFTIDHRSGADAPRAWNRPDQRYLQPQSVLIANRTARAALEYPNTVIVLGELGLYEVRSPSGNNYDVNSIASSCDCPDYDRLVKSHAILTSCKHIYMVGLALADGTLPEGIPWGAAKLAEAAGVEIRTAQQWCARGECAATKRFGIWIIQPSDGATMVTLFNSRRITGP